MINAELNSDLELELLELIKFHMDIYTTMIKEEAGDPEAQAKFDLFVEHKKLVEERLVTKKKIFEDMQKENACFDDNRTNAECEKCEDVRNVEIIGEEYSEQDWMHDIVVCKVCQSEFLNQIPNNWPDRVKYFDFMIEQLTAIREMSVDTPGAAQQMQIFIDQYQAMKNIQLKVFESQKQLLKSDENVEKTFLDLHDYLLNSKLSMLNFNNPNASA